MMSYNMSHGIEMTKLCMLLLVVALLGTLCAGGCSRSEGNQQLAITEVSIKSKSCDRVIFDITGTWLDGCGTFSHFEMDGDGYDYTTHMYGNKLSSDKCDDAPIDIKTYLDISLPEAGTYYFDFGQTHETIAIQGRGIELPITITIGNITDITGPAASTMEIFNTALEDMVNHYNEQNLIPDIELDVYSYDGQYDPAKVVPGYEWLRSKGADIFFTPIMHASSIISNWSKRDDADIDPILFSLASTEEALSPNGRSFVLGSSSEQEAYTLLNWIADNDWDYVTNGPAKIGIAYWDSDEYGIALRNAIAKYVKIHPDQYEWGEYQLGSAISPNHVFEDWDYFVPPTAMPAFIVNFRNAGFTGKFVGTNAHTILLDQIDEAEVWDEFDRALFTRATPWWTDENEAIELTRNLLYKYHPLEAEEIMRSGSGYLAITYINQMLEIVKNAGESVCAANFDEALYNSAQSFSIDIGGFPYSFNDVKRTSADSLAIYEICASEKNLFRLSPEWIPVVTEP